LESIAAAQEIEGHPAIDMDVLSEEFHVGVKEVGCTEGDLVLFLPGGTVVPGNEAAELCREGNWSTTIIPPRLATIIIPRLGV